MRFDDTWTFTFSPYCKRCKVYPDFKTEQRGAFTVIVLKYNNPELRTNTRQAIPTIILNHRPSNNERIRMY